MFYSHEILTNRQYGVATIWLVATLGSKSNLKKISRRAILDVDLQKACKTITEPEVPLALRLQGSLLFGVSRVFQQQCGYVLTDITSLRDRMRETEHVFKEVEFDPDVRKTRPEQLSLAEDPYFIPDIDIYFDLSSFGFSPRTSSSSGNASSSLTLPSSQTSHTSSDEAGEIRLEIPLFDTPAGGFSGFGVPFGEGTSSVAQTGNGADPPSIFEEEPTVIDDALFDVDEDGFLHPTISDSLRGLQLPSDVGLPLPSDAGASDRGGRVHPPIAGRDDPMATFDDEMSILGNGELVPPPPAPQIPLTPEPADGAFRQGTQPMSSVEASEESSETADAPQRLARMVKAIRPDRQTELSNRDLNEWNLNYLANMAAASRTRQGQLANSKAKKNAEFWILQQGLGNIASCFGDDRVPHPLAVFSGQSLWDMLRGELDHGKKRSRSGSLTDAEREEDRRVRARTSSQEEVARGREGERLQHADYDGLLFQGHDLDVEIEVGRHGPPSLPDYSSGMPWNISGSRQSSAQPLGSGHIPRLSSSVGGLYGGMELGPPSALGKRGSRFTSASPLFGRGLASLSRQSSPGPLSASQVTNNEDEFADLDAQLGADIDPDFELYGPSAIVDTQTAVQSRWAATTLEKEAYNFLSFVNMKIQEKGEQQEEAIEEERGAKQAKITLDELLPPTQNSPIVGAQALLHVLALTTKGLLKVSQAGGFASDIEISVVSY
ncbi:uncharacterized protein Z519_02100 [Cladophialophora bantiana CBS 173.52]|uniref:Rad21/Rec8-like protein N-terminal domain-containing protein n=1 Tax=Cladophialophora bantiana (strain ATCC 10958 / CBS 173.52 / CDC B-1940 / NIH 8579) TaxID=1442370 RepID=A0A0D2IIU9_CLAB1|nr:uncharacterized protein Z519_02100 [Cladophialophora bantiana CBS 173.52]KIW96709.1 hypothetical protein Z519_02100 [Cladophialophora bantiana CBS 173.52]